MNSTLSVVVFLLQIRRRRERVSTHPAPGDLLDNAEQDGDDNDGLEGLPEYNKEDRNGEHVRHVCFEDVAGENDDVREGEGAGKAREEANAVGVSLGWRVTGLGSYQIKNYQIVTELDLECVLPLPKVVKVMVQRSILLFNSHRLFQILHIHSREGPLGGELLDFPPELLHQLGALLALLFGGSGSDEVFQELAAGFLLNQQRNLDSTMQEFRDGFDIRFEHVTRSQS